MTNYDIERIENFMNTFKQSTDDIFALLGIGACRMAVLMQGDTSMEQTFHDMDVYIFNELQKNSRRCQ